MTDNKIEDAMVCSACDTKRKVGYDYICGHTSNIDVGTPDNHWRDRRGNIDKQEKNNEPNNQR